jgi:hypothetical protein
MKALLAWLRNLRAHQKAVKEFCDATDRFHEAIMGFAEAANRIALQQMKTTPHKCPHNRDLTDQELEQIVADGEKLNKAEKKEPREGDEWKGGE